ncbi:MULTISPECIES: hypothetical protein [Chryseobacterium]|uniref:N-acetyltransferase domain-containing protein n=1 Tax=Chryseobacterium camelliae TaxID=1265445 RepID=A0ABU0TNQ7_9FLAO|nr:MULTISPECIES: hypothetical protein [Chryseobacterium]MDT3407467.1 hypothetical protein [Pseudacidovorax intermedius]MDQ1098681.1 hypothetical protein [Chryseobacterium camelliae]MDQ1102608.1 hypothetical protein [Chryseobacterium sp. SORGH_AS_1048]MDR6086038.1 hypothetical protein [Chryseobacterium sp. SORGH_AS_0909]MDR6130406.1 hypothetical protein [Chryseobacterium sp. SORGH_AS_1175]
MIIVEEVQNENQKREFLEFPARLYQNDKNYIRPLDKDIEDVFNTEKNKFFKDGVCTRFLFKNKQHETVGKTAVFINRQYQQKQPTGGIGFFDCIHDQQTANFIFDYCRNWLQERGIEAMDGPINFGERDKFWGLLTEGFIEPLYGMNYNYPYYKTLFENYGFKVYFEQLCFSRPVFGEVSRVFTIMHAKHKRNPSISAMPMKKNNLEKFAKDFTEVYNKAWATHGEGKKIEEAKILKMFKTMKPIINEHISWFVYEGEKPIAMWINIPDLNQWFKYLNGQFGFLEKLKFAWVKKFRKNEKMVGLVFGVVPEWQKKGIEGYMIWEGTQHLRKHTDFKITELQWIGDFNPKMIRIAENLDTTVTRKLATYRYLFDREKEFERHPELN